MPNGTLLSGNLMKGTLLGRARRNDAEVGVAYGSDLARVPFLLLATARATAGVAAEAAPIEALASLGESSVNFRVRAWTADYDRWIDLRSELLKRVSDARRLAGSVMPVNQFDLNLRGAIDEARAIRSPVALKS